jgi:hypothetical protein
VLEVAAIQQDHRPLQAGHQRGGDLVEVVGPGLVGVALGAELLVDVGMEQSDLGLGQPPQAVAELPVYGQQRRLVAPEGGQRRSGQLQQQAHHAR